MIIIIIRRAIFIQGNLVNTMSIVINKGLVEAREAWKCSLATFFDLITNSTKPNMLIS